MSSKEKATAIVIIIHNSLDNAAEYDETLNQLVIRATDDSHA